MILRRITTKRGGNEEGVAVLRREKG